MPEQVDVPSEEVLDSSVVGFLVSVPDEFLGVRRPAFQRPGELHFSAQNQTSGLIENTKIFSLGLVSSTAKAFYSR